VKKKAIALSFIAVLAVVAACDDASEVTTVASADAGAEASSLVDLGKLYVKNRGCSDCHQSPNLADGLLTGQTEPRPFTKAFPKNLTPDPDTGIDSWTDQNYIDAIRDGIDDEGNELCNTMPKFPTMSDEEGKAIAAYLRSLTPVWRPIPESVCEHAEEDAGDAATE
jgi:mono/diheme cytochrome c family protein